MATFFRRKAAAVALGVLTLTLAGGGIAAAAQPSANAPVGAVQPGAQQPGHQPSVTAAQSKAAKDAIRVAAVPGAGTVAWAVVSANGTLLQHSANVTGAFKFPCCAAGQFAGQYQVTLDYDVHLKAYVAGVGTNDSANVPPGGEVAVAPRLLTPNAVFVQTRSSAGAFEDKPFHIVIAN